MAKKKNGTNKGKITRERNKVIESIRIQNRAENEKRIYRPAKIEEVERSAEV